MKSPLTDKGLLTDKFGDISRVRFLLPGPSIKLLKQYAGIELLRLLRQLQELVVTGRFKQLEFRLYTLHELLRGLDVRY